MGAIWKNDFRLLWNGKRAGIILLLTLLLNFGAWTILQQTEETEPVVKERITIGVANRDESIYAKMLVSYFTENPVFTAYVSVIIDEE